MRLGSHYYVLSLGLEASALFEAFRDSLVDVENQGFPVRPPPRTPEAPAEPTIHELARNVDRHFAPYYSNEPLRLVVVGDTEMQSAFDSVTAHGAAIIGRIEGDHTGTSARDLGEIVWPIVKESMSGLQDRAMQDLEDCRRRGRLVSGLEAVIMAAGQEANATLLVEDDYHKRGSVSRTSGTPLVTSDVDIRNAVDDIVDAVIEKVLESAGHVVFTRPGILRAQQQIVLLPRGTTVG